MDTDEKLTALKKAYADIILSISKEAAARVLASERKSARYQHELKVAKEEGVRMLLRLKQMMDFQVCESKSASLNQQKKIDELEAQLHEAEDIVKDLREELENVQSEVGRLRKEKLQRVNEPVPCPSQRSICGKCRYKLVCSCSAYVADRDLPTIILRSKEPGQYRNGCTQRILACERNLLDRDSHLSVETDNTKGDDNDREQEPGLRPSPDTVMPQNGPTFAKSSEKENHHVEICSGRAMWKDEVTAEVVPLQEKTGFSDCLPKLDAEKVDLPSEGLELNSSDTTNVFASQPVKERVIKYTFQRKRKRPILNGAEVDGSLEMERKTVDVINCDQKIDQVKPSLTMESTRESRRLAQVARQLISLSEKKWWN